MICTGMQRQLLSIERADRPPPEVREHLESCAECREVQRRLLDMEQRVRQLPVPESEGRSAFVLQFLEGQLPTRHVPPQLRLREGGRRKLAIALGLAAGLAICALGLWAWTSHAPDPPDHGLARRGLRDREEQLHQRLTQARSARERVQGLTELADDVLGEARTLVADAAGMDEVAHFYGQVIREHLLTHARTLSQAERAALLPAIAERLRWAESEAMRLAVDPAYGSTASSFREIASAAGEGNRRLLALSRGEPA
jgi:hypothetical protein